MRIFFTIMLVALPVLSFSQTERVWEKIPNAPVITTENAKNYSSYENTLESVLNYFFASRIRKDNDWEKVVLLPENRTRRLIAQLKDYETWTVTKFNLISKTEIGPGKFWVKVNIWVVIDGKKDGGIDEAEVQFIDGKWIITGIPT